MAGEEGHAARRGTQILKEFKAGQRVDWDRSLITPQGLLPSYGQALAGLIGAHGEGQFEVLEVKPATAAGTACLQMLKLHTRQGDVLLSGIWFMAVP